MSNDTERIKLALDVIAQTLDGIEKRSQTYGSYEACEMETLAVVNLRQVLVGYPHFDTLSIYCRFIHEVNGQTDNRPLFQILDDEGQLSELPRLLGDFARWVAQEWPPLSAELNELTKEGT